MRDDKRIIRSKKVTMLDSIRFSELQNRELLLLKNDICKLQCITCESQTYYLFDLESFEKSLRFSLSKNDKSMLEN